MTSYVRHIIKYDWRDGVKLTPHQIETWCGHQPKCGEWLFQDAQHALLSIEQGSCRFRASVAWQQLSKRRRGCEVESNAFNKMMARALMLSWKRRTGPFVKCPECCGYLRQCKLCHGAGRVIQEDIDAWKNPASRIMREKRDA